ncbi:MAG: hypothetical protein ABIT38_10090, partial [Gemmatimonadaceae bacterium]
MTSGGGRGTPAGGGRAMTKTPERPVRAQASLTDTGDAYLRRAGRALIVSVYGAMRVIRLYPPENEAVRNALGDLALAAQAMIDREHELEFRVSNEFIFVNATRLRLDLDNYASFSQILSMMRAAGVGSVRVSSGAQSRDWLVFLSQLQSASESNAQSGDASDSLFDLVHKLEAAGV